MSVVSASALARFCGHGRVVNKTATKSKRQQAACDKGTLFHSAIELWAKGGRIPDVNDAEVSGWLQTLAMQWEPRPGMEFEIALGLSPLCTYVEVDEPEPHVYVSRDGSPLLTAGRGDVAWTEAGVAKLRDNKTGRYVTESASTNLQLHSLGLAWAAKTKCDAYQVEIYYARDGSIDRSDVIPLDSDEAAARWEDVRQAALLDETPRPGEWCMTTCWPGKLKKCPHRKEQ